MNIKYPNKAAAKKRVSFMKDAAVKVFPIFQQERTQSFMVVVLTLMALIIFGLFAISPTVGTILQLRKQLDDNTLVYNELFEKVHNLSILQGKYNALQPDLPVVLAAIPDTHHMPELTAQVQALATKHHLAFITMESNPLLLNNLATITNSSISFSLTVQGQKSNILNFITDFISFERIITIDQILVSTTTTQAGISTQALIEGRAYFKPFE